MCKSIKDYEAIDQDARNKIKNELNKNFMVEAGAGSGKTTELVTRIINQITSGNFKVEEIVAITFTKKAATELKERFQMELEKEHIKETDIEKKEKIIKPAIDNLNKSFIGTIHSFCGNLLKTRPIEAGISLDFVEMESNEEEKYQEEIWQEYLDVKYNEKKDLIRELKENKVSINTLKEAFKDLCNYSDIVIPKTVDVLDYNQSFIDEVINGITMEINELITCIPTETKYAIQDETYKIKDRIDNASSYEEKYEILKDVVIYTKTKEKFKKYGKKWNGDDSKRWIDIEKANKKLDNIKNIYVKQFEDKIKNYNTKTEIYEKCMLLLEDAKSYYNERKQQESILGFQDLLTKSRNMLRDNKEVRKYFSNKYKYLLVDEFQDTDPIQAEIMFFLTSINIEEKDWKKCKLKEGSLFVVGDPKQSIYRFRNADISIYNEVKKLIIENNGEILQLTKNFRSVDTMCQWFNDKLPELLSKTEDNKYQARFSHIVNTKKTRKECLNNVYQILIEDKELNNITGDLKLKDKNNLLSAKKISSFIAEQLNNKSKITDKDINRTVEPRDFMVLTEFKYEVSLIKKELEKRNIPCIGTGKFDLAEEYTINSLLNLLKFLDNLQDKIAFVGAIKGLFGISDDMLLEAKKSGLHFTLKFEENPKSEKEDNLFKEDIDEETEKRLKNFLEARKKIAKLYSYKRNYNPITALEKIIEELKIIPWILSIEEKENYKALYQILELLRNDSEACYDFSKMIKFIEGIYEKEQKEIIEVSCNNENAVRVMNVHQSKGLEAPIVILASPKTENIENDSQDNDNDDDNDGENKEEKIRKNPKKHIEYKNGVARGYFRIGDKKDNIAPYGWNILFEEEKKYLQEENKRIEYVAATRAKNMLIIISNENNKDNWAWRHLYDKDLEKISVVENNDIKYKCGSNVNYKIEIEDVGDWIKPLSLKTYKFTQPTMEKGKRTEVELEDGGSAEWGNIVHEVFENIVKKNNYVNELMIELINNSKNNKENLQKLQEEVDKFKKHDLMKEILSAQNSYCEVPFGLKVEKDEYIYSLCKKTKEKEEKKAKIEDPDIDEVFKSNKDIYINGIIDLVIRVGDSYKIIDYKSDHIKYESDVENRAKDYYNQIIMYKEIWEKLSGKEVKECILYFSHLGVSHIVDIDERIIVKELEPQL